MACFAMLIVAGLGASVYFDSEFVTRRLRGIEIAAWSLAGLALAGTVAFLSCSAVCPIGRRTIP
jgi:hypothetical protein